MSQKKKVAFIRRGLTRTFALLIAMHYSQKGRRPPEKNAQCYRYKRTCILLTALSATTIGVNSST